MIGNARLEVDCSRNFDYIKRKRSVTDDSRVNIESSARSQLKTIVVDAQLKKLFRRSVLIKF